MRTVAGLFLAAILLLPLAVVAQNSIPQQTPYVASQNELPPIMLSPDHARTRTFAWNTKPLLRQDLSSFGGQDVCYTMRVLVVARDRGSDRTHLVGQRTCTPASQFRMNHSAPSSDK